MNPQLHDPDPRAELLTIAGVADLLRSPIATLRYWRYAGTGPRSFNIGRRVVYSRSELDAWIATQMGDGAA